MANAGLTVISSGANVPFADSAIFYGPIAEYADNRLAVIPDFIANCGMARVFAYLMSNTNIGMSDEAIFEDTSVTIRAALENVYQKNPAVTKITSSAFEIALSKLI
jgi:glutamate dehydrogenase/leucine dehydrogenase